MSARRWIATVSLAAAVWAGAAFACPACAGRDNENPNRTAVFVGAMILLPWAISVAVVLGIRKLERESSLNPHGDLQEP